MQNDERKKSGRHNISERKCKPKWMKSICTAVILSMLLGLCGCVGGADGTATNASGDNPVENGDVNGQETIDQGNAEGDGASAEAEDRVSTPEHDYDIGLNALSVDQLPEDVSEQERMTVEYFDKDYMFINSYEALQRYTPIFEDSLVEFYANVAKIISYEGDDFEILVYMIENSDETYAETYASEERLMLIKGSSQDARVILGDNVLVRGRVKGMVSTDVDGISIMVPEIETIKGCILGGGYYYYPNMYSYDELKEFASGIFGEDIMFREASGEELLGSVIPYHVCTLEDQSNIKLSSYEFHDRVGGLSDHEHPEYRIQVGADGEHFLLAMERYDVNTLTLEYYDNDLNCLWSREFTYSNSPCFDITKSNLYMCMGNELYIINLETGEDTFASQFVGEKIAVRKYEDGIFMVAAGGTDTYMYTDLQGNILWRVNADRNIPLLLSIQKVNETLVIQDEDAENSYYDSSSGGTRGIIDSYIVLDINTGEIIRQGEVEVGVFHNYG